MNKNQIEQEQLPKIINWQEIKNKVNFFQDALSQKILLSPEEKRAKLKARAQVLAEEEKDNITQKEFIEIIYFRLASETYAIETAFVREVYPLKDYTTLPGVPAFIIGIINVRGQIISVIDLKKFFNLPEKGIGELNKVIIIQNEFMEFGILSDVILGVKSIPFDFIQASLSNFSGIGSNYLKGVTNEHLIILNAKNILEDEKIIINQFNNKNGGINYEIF